MLGFLMCLAFLSLKVVRQQEHFCTEKLSISTTFAQDQHKVEVFHYILIYKIICFLLNLASHVLHD